MILEGMDVFESECQCNVMATSIDSDITFCSMDTIMSRTNHLPRNTLAVEDRYIVTHVDVGFDYLTYVTMSSGHQFTGHIIDYGTFPSYQHRFAKGKMSNTLRKVYPNIPIPEDRLTAAIVDLTNSLAQRTYTREDGVRLKHNLITVDRRAFTPYIEKAIRMSPFNHLIYPAEGIGLKARDRGIAEKNYSTGATKYHHCVLMPTPDHTMLKLTVDVNHFKSFTHVAFSREVSQVGSLSLFIPEFDQQHVIIAEHCIAESPSWDVDPKTDKRVVVWTQTVNDNEFFDNIVGCLSALAIQNVHFDVQDAHETEGCDINEFIRKYS